MNKFKVAMFAVSMIMISLCSASEGKKVKRIDKEQTMKDIEARLQAAIQVFEHPEEVLEKEVGIICEYKVTSKVLCSECRWARGIYRNCETCRLFKLSCNVANTAYKAAIRAEENNEQI